MPTCYDYFGEGSKTEVNKVLSISILGSIINSSLNNTSKIENGVIFQVASHRRYFKRILCLLAYKRPMRAQFVSFSFTPVLRSVWKDVEKEGLEVGSGARRLWILKRPLLAPGTPPNFTSDTPWLPKKQTFYLWCTLYRSYASVHPVMDLGSVPERPINANPGLKMLFHFLFTCLLLRVTFNN